MRCFVGEDKNTNTTDGTLEIWYYFIQNNGGESLVVQPIWNAPPHRLRSM